MTSSAVAFLLLLHLHQLLFLLPLLFLLLLVQLINVIKVNQLRDQSANKQASHDDDCLWVSRTQHDNDDDDDVEVAAGVSVYL